MTKQALKLFRQCAAGLIPDETGALRPPLNRAYRDGYAALWLWINCGQPVERLTDADVVAVPPDLRLAEAPLRRVACGYTLPTGRDGDWIVMARVAAREPIRVHSAAYAYAEPVIVYAGHRAIEGQGDACISGIINLRDHPTALKLAPGHYYHTAGAWPIDQSEADDDTRLVAMCLGRFFSR